MRFIEITSKSILRKHKKADSWFITRYGMNLYRGCNHNCAYCDGRAENYYVQGEFDEDVEVKVNAPQILARELSPKRKRIPLKPGFVGLVGGVGDAYQAAEKKYQLTRQALELILENDFSTHILTKSTLVERDLDLLEKINEKNRVLVSFSFSTADDRISALFEPGAPLPSERFKTLALLKQRKIPCGLFLLPVIPFITDAPQMLDKAVKTANELELDYAAFGGMTLKPGRQKDHFMATLKTHFPDLLGEYGMIYSNNRWGGASQDYYGFINNLYHTIVRRYKIPPRIPARLYQDILDENDLVMVILDQMDYMIRLRGGTSPYGYAAHSISKIKEPLSLIRKELRNLKGVGKVTERIILEILDTRRSSFYEKLLQE